MHRSRILPAIAAAVATTPLLGAEDPHGQYDFWLGEWTVANRHLRGGEWSESGMSRALITPVLGGRAVLEQWDGQTDGIAGVFGFSLRWYDEDLQRWVVLLNWPGGSPRAPGFGRMEGGFEDGACHLFPPDTFAGPGIQRRRDAIRYTFSDATPDSCRWSQATPAGRGTWHTTWIMEFAREEPARDDDVPIDVRPAPEACACEAEEARSLDGLIGVWSAPERDAQVRISSAIRGCLVFVSIRLDPHDAPAEEHFVALGYEPGPGRWTARSLDGELRLAALSGVREDGALMLRADRSSHPDRRADVLTIAPDGEGLTLSLRRAGEDVLDLRAERD